MKKDNQELVSTDERIAAVGGWIKDFSETGVVGEMDVATLKDALEACGASLEEKPELSFLREYTNKAKRPGLNAVWGEERVNEFWGWIDEFIETYEKTTGQKLPGLGKSGPKFSGMRQFFGELTAYAARQTNLDTFRLYSEARVLNGRLWQEGRKDKRIKVSVPTTSKPILLSSYPPAYPLAAWERIKSWKK